MYYHPHIPRIFCVLGNCLRGLFKSVGDQYIICELSGILDQCISNKVNDAAKNKSKSQINLTDVCRLEKMMDIVKTVSSATQWEELVQQTVLMDKYSPLEGMCAGITHTQMTSMYTTCLRCVRCLYAL